MDHIRFKLLAKHSIKQRTVGILHGFNSNSNRMAVAVAGGSPRLCEPTSRTILHILFSFRRTMKQASFASSIVHGGGKRRTEGMAVR